MRDHEQRAAELPVAKLFLSGFALILLLKLWFAAVLDLYSDEVFYWQASTNPAIAYSDLPFMTSLLAGLGSAISPGNAFAVRILFILLGSSLPFLLYWLARPICGKRQALESAALCLCLPLGGFLGLLAVPDVPLLFFGLLSIGFFERALRLNHIGYWLATGACLALGLSTHYRFFLYPAAAVLFLCSFRPARQQWQNPLLWLAIAVAAVGLTPVIWFNLSHDLSSAGFYFADRHPWEFQAGGLLHLFKQAGLVTPPLYIVFLVTAWLLYGQSKAANRSAALLLSFALVNLLVYLLLAPWTDADSTSVHWPLSGYFPLLVFAPYCLRKIHRWCLEKRDSTVARRIVISVPLLGYLGSLTALLAIGSQAFQQPLQSMVGAGILSNKMAGWQEFADHTAALLEARFPDAAPVIVTGNYYTAAQAEFAGLTATAITLDRDKAVRDGRITQYRLWGQDESGLQQSLQQSLQQPPQQSLQQPINRPLLYINEDSTLTVPDKQDLMAVMCGYVDRLEPVSELSLFNGDKRFSFYQAESIVDQRDTALARSYPCPFPARAWIDNPEDGAELSGEVTVSGWAYNEDIGVDSVHLLIDGRRIARADYGINREDVVRVMGVSSDPDRPRLGFAVPLDTRTLSDGEHSLSIEITNRQGHTSDYGLRKVRIAN